MVDLMRFVTVWRILIPADSNSRSKTWHNFKTNSRGRKLEEYLASKHLHLINEESDRSTFLNSTSSSNIELTITKNNQIAAAIDREMNEEEHYPTTIILNIKSVEEEPANRTKSTQARVIGSS